MKCALLIVYNEGDIYELTVIKCTSQIPVKCGWI